MITCKVGKEIINCYDGIHNKEQLKKWAKKNILICPVCNKPYEYCHGEFKSPYFRHKEKCECEDRYSESESTEHINGKRDLFEWIKIQDGVTETILEGWLPETKQRPDIMFKWNEKQYVIEYQCTPIASEYIERHELYKSAGIIDIWVLGTKEYCNNINQESTQNKRGRVIEDYTSFYYDSLNSVFMFKTNLTNYKFNFENIHIDKIKNYADIIQSVNNNKTFIFSDRLYLLCTGFNNINFIGDIKCTNEHRSVLIHEYDNFLNIINNKFLKTFNYICKKYKNRKISYSFNKEKLEFKLNISSCYSIIVSTNYITQNWIIQTDDWNSNMKEIDDIDVCLTNYVLFFIEVLIIYSKIKRTLKNYNCNLSFGKLNRHSNFDGRHINCVTFDIFGENANRYIAFYENLEVSLDYENVIQCADYNETYDKIINYLNKIYNLSMPLYNNKELEEKYKIITDYLLKNFKNTIWGTLSQFNQNYYLLSPMIENIKHLTLMEKENICIFNDVIIANHDNKQESISIKDMNKCEIIETIKPIIAKNMYSLKEYINNSKEQEIYARHCICIK